jgi:hypothetical protein
MKEFVSDREALDYLAGRIIAEAAREKVSLLEVERKMLYFSETDWTLPDMAAVSAEFDRTYDQDEYEQKISGLVRKIEAHDHKEDRDEEAKWHAAVEKLSDGDRYLLVLLNPLLSESERAGRPPHDILKLWLTAFNIVFGLLALGALGNWLFGAKFRAAADWVFQDRDHFWLIVIFVGLAWYFGTKLKSLLRGVLIRK